MKTNNNRLASIISDPKPPNVQDDGQGIEARMTVRPIFAWYDLWIGVFYDRAKRRLYVFPVPCIGFYVEFSP